jgi:hypothetical protein
MNLEEKLRMAKRFNYDNIKVDLNRFEDRLFKALSENKEVLSENKRFMKGRMQIKWKLASLVVALGIVTPGLVLASGILNVHNHTISRLKIEVPPTSFITNGINNQNIAKVYDLSQARAVANFPIRESASISGWKHEESKGFLWKRAPLPEKKSSTDKSTGVDAYYDVYTNSSGQQVTVQQSGGLDANTYGNNPDGSKIQFSSNNNQEANLYTTSSGGQKELLITKKESNNTITHIEITGNVTTDDLQTIGDAYITATDNK